MPYGYAANGNLQVMGMDGPAAPSVSLMDQAANEAQANTSYTPPTEADVQRMLPGSGSSAMDQMLGGGAGADTGGLGSLGKWWESLGPKKQLMLGGGLGLLGLMMRERAQYQPPGADKYSGPLSKFSYDPGQYHPYTYKPYAGGGSVEQMSNQNAVGANTGFPMANMHTAAYATPYQTPISQNVLSGDQDTNIDPYTGEEKLAGGGAAKVDNMAAIDNYMSQASSGEMAAVLAKAKSGDYNAMLALNKLRGTPNQNYAGGGIADLGGYSDGGRLLRGPGDGVSDSIPATIGNRQPARLADGEFVVPARIVSELGNGSTEAGAKQLYAMMDRVQRARGKTTGKGKVAANTKASKYLPA
jgi:hypothetical protein